MHFSHRRIVFSPIAATAQYYEALVKLQYGSSKNDVAVSKKWIAMDFPPISGASKMVQKLISPYFLYEISPFRQAGPLENGLNVPLEAQHDGLEPLELLATAPNIHGMVGGLEHVLMTFHRLGMSSSQLTNSIFQRGRYTTNQP